MASDQFKSLATSLILITLTCVTWGDLPVKLADVISAADLEAEVSAKAADLEGLIATAKSFQDEPGKRKQAAAQLAVLAQALTEHEHASKLKLRSPTVRDAAIALGKATSFELARSAAETLHEAMLDQSSSTSEPDFNWSHLAGTRVLMESMRERTDLVRKALRRTKDPNAEARQAGGMAVLALAIAAHGDDIPDSDRQRQWREWSLELQAELTTTANALRQKDRDSALEHFTAAQTACDKCHDKFKK